MSTPAIAKSMARSFSQQKRQQNIEHQKMAQELFKFSKDFIEEFDRLCPPQICYYESGTEKGRDYGAYNYYSQTFIDKNGDMAFIRVLYENSYNDFCDRWNTFQKLKAFL